MQPTFKEVAESPMRLWTFETNQTTAHKTACFLGAINKIIWSPPHCSIFDAIKTSNLQERAKGITPTSTKWFENKAELIGFITINLLGLAGSLATYRLLNGYPYNYGKNLIGLFIPPLLIICYQTFVAFKYGLNAKTFGKIIVSFFIQVAPFAPLFFQVFQPNGIDDFTRSYIAAKNMIDHRTLWGGDQLYFPDAGVHYVIQPGYRYFVLLELLLFRDLYRFVTFFNILIYLVAVFGFQKAILSRVENKKLQLCLLLLVLLFSPFAIKNSMMELAEWVTVVLLMIFCYLLVVSERKAMAVFCLGLVPFFRQNLLIAVLLLFFCVLATNKHRIKLAVFFLLPLCIPFYHNLYYAGKWRYFVDISRMPYLTYKGKTAVVTGFKYEQVISGIIHYFGFDINKGQIGFSFLAALFLPFSVVVYFLLLRAIRQPVWKAFFVFTTLSVVVPVIFLGIAYYPRFEFVNVVVFLTTFLTILYCTPSNQKVFERRA